MAETAALILVVVCVWLGAAGSTWWTVFVLAVAGTVIYVWMRPIVLARMAQQGRMLVWVPATYIAQVVTTGILFAIGRGIGSLF